MIEAARWRSLNRLPRRPIGTSRSKLRHQMHRAAPGSFLNLARPMTRREKRSIATASHQQRQPREAWDEAFAARRQGATPHAEFPRLLAERMPEL